MRKVLSYKKRERKITLSLCFYRRQDVQNDEEHEALANLRVTCRGPKRQRLLSNDSGANHVPSLARTKKPSAPKPTPAMPNKPPSMQPP